MDDYPEDEANSKVIKKTDTGKNKGGNPTSKAWRKPEDAMLPKYNGQP